MNNLPPFITKYFWGDNLNELNWETHKEYIVRTILEKGNLEAVRWVLKSTDKETLKKIINKKMDPKSQHFWKLYLSTEGYNLKYLLEKLKNKYSNTDYNLVHILKSLIYFEDAEKQPMPRMHKKVEWEEVKSKITKEVKNFKLE